MAPRYFTLDQAQALLPQVRARLGQALQLHGHLRASITALDEAGSQIDWPMLRGEMDLDELDDDTADTLERARMLYQALRESVVAIEALGVEVKGLVDGLVDFRSWHEGEREVLLCYKLGEPEIRFFHGLEDGFAGRQSVRGQRFTAEPDAKESPAASVDEAGTAS